MSKKPTLDQLDQIREIVLGPKVASDKKNFSRIEEIFEKKYNKAFQAILKSEAAIEFQAKESQSQLGSALNTMHAKIGSSKSKLEKKIDSVEDRMISLVEEKFQKMEDAISTIFYNIDSLKLQFGQDIQSIESQFNSDLGDTRQKFEKTGVKKSEFAEALLELSFQFSESSESSSVNTVNKKNRKIAS